MIGMLWNLIILNPMINALLIIYSGVNWVYLLALIGAFGIAIILFTLLVRLITHPLTVQQLKGTQKMQEFQRSEEWQAIQKKYKDDKQKLQQEQMKMYKEMGINPLGSCLPTLIQFPIIIGLYQAISRVMAVTPLQMVSMYDHVYPFVNVSKLLPVDNTFLWMNLSQPERVYIMGYGIPVLAIIVVATTYIQSKLMAPPTQQGDQGAQMAQAMNLYMPLFMGYLALTFPSGLSLYFITSNVASILQYGAMGKLNWKNIIPGRKAVPQLPPESTTKPKPAAKTTTKERSKKST